MLADSAMAAYPMTNAGTMPIDGVGYGAMVATNGWPVTSGVIAALAGGIARPASHGVSADSNQVKLACLCQRG